MRLTKRDVEQLTAVLDRPPAATDAELAGVRDALAVALAVALDTTGAFDELVEVGAAVGGWDDRRVAALLADDPAVARPALWDLVAELNEQRDVVPAPPSGKAQREAVSAIERAITALAKGDAVAVRKAAAALADLDRRSLYPSLPAVLGAAAPGAVEAGQPLPATLVQSIVNALGPGPLGAEARQRLT